MKLIFIMTPIIGFIAIVLISAVTATGDYFMKLAGNTEKYMDLKWFLIGLFLYLITAFAWFVAFKSIKVSSIGVIYGITTAVILAMIGVIFFHEKLSPVEIIGVILGLLSLILLLRFN